MPSSEEEFIGFWPILHDGVDFLLYIKRRVRRHGVKYLTIFPIDGIGTVVYVFSTVGVLNF